MAKFPKVPFNCLLPTSTVKAIKDQAEADKCSQAEVVHRAIALMCFGDEIRKTPITSNEIAASVKAVARQVDRPISRMREKGDKSR